MASLILLHIIGGVCLLLFGLTMVKSGVTRAFGLQLRKIISVATKNRFTALLAGVGVTALLQSSTATTMIISSFAGQGLIATTAGLAVVLGADIGTTIVAQVLTFDLTWLSPVLLIAGYISYSGKNHAGTRRQIGRILIGLGLMLLALATIKMAAIPLKTSETLPLILSNSHMQRIDLNHKYALKPMSKRNNQVPQSFQLFLPALLGILQSPILRISSSS